MALPDTYKQIEYIESSGTQYIDTGVNANQYLSYEADFQAITTTGSTTNTTLFGARTASNTNRFGLMIYSNTFHMMIGSTNAFNTAVDTNRHKCSVFMNNGAFTSNIDGTEETGSPGTSVYVNQNFLLFKINYGSDGALPYRLYSFKLYTGNSTLVRDFIPCYRIIDGVAGLYDLVNDVFYTNQGTGVFIQGPAKDRKIPSAYKEVEYIQSNPTNPGDSTGTYQYINTGYNPTLNTEISIDIQLTNTANQSTLFGETTSNTSYLSFISYVNSSNHWCWYMRNGNSGNPTDTGVTVDTNRHTFVVNKTTYKIYTDGVQVYSGTNTNSPTTNGNIPLYLFANNSGGNPNIVSAAKIYSCKIWDNGTLVRDFVPVIRKSDNKPGLYDLVNNVFYTNAGTGEFTYKEYAESGKIQKIYIGNQQVRPSGSPVKTFNIVGGLNTEDYQQTGCQIQYVNIEVDYYNDYSPWTGQNLKLYIPDSSTQGFYIYGGQNVDYYNYGGKFEGSGGDVYHYTYKVTRGGTTHISVTIGRSDVKIKIGTNPEGTYTYSSSIATLMNSILDASNMGINATPSSSSSISNGVATITYEPV